MSEILRLFLRNSIFMAMIKSGSLIGLNDLSNSEKLSENAFRIHTLVLGAEIDIDKVYITRKERRFSISLFTKEDELYKNSERYFLSETNDLQERNEIGIERGSLKKSILTVLMIIMSGWLYRHISLIVI